MKQSVRSVSTLILCLVLSLSGLLVRVPVARATSTGTWIAVNSGLSGQLDTYCLAIDPTNPSTLYAGVLNGGVFRSTNGGATWTCTGITDTVIWALAINPLVPTTIYAGTAMGVFRSTNSGMSWAEVNSGLTQLDVRALAINPLVPSIVYAGMNDTGVFRSTNGGDTWTAVNTGLVGLGVYALAINPSSPSIVYAGIYNTGGGVFRSTNGGDTWASIGVGITDPYSKCLAIDPLTPTTLYLGTYNGGGVFRSTNGGDTWTQSPVFYQRVYSLAIDPHTPTTLYAGTSLGGVFRSTDSGATWVALNDGLGNLTVNAITLNPAETSTVYAGTIAGGIFRYYASYTLTTTASPFAGGTIDRSPSATAYVSGTLVTLTAIPAPGYTFMGWTGDLTGTANPTTITMTGNKTVMATFAAIPTYSLVPSAATGGTISPSTPQTVLQGASQTFTVSPSAGYHIADVTVDGVSVGAVSSYTFTNVQASHSIAGSFSPDSYSLTVSPPSHGTVTKSPDQATYTYNASVAVTATAATGWHFVSWFGDLTGAANPTNVIMTSNKTIGANFAINTYSLTTSTSGSGSVVKSPDQATYDHGSSVQLTATPGVGYMFTGWTGDATGMDNPLTVTMTASKSISATFVQAFTLGVAASPSASGTVTRNPDQVVYASGTGVQLTAVPATGYVFSGWFGDITGVSNPIVVPMTGNKNVSASFTALANEYSLVVVPSPAAGGNVTKSPDQAHYTAGSVVHLTATPAAGYTFNGWSGDLAGSLNPVVITMTGNKTVTAIFTSNVFALSVNVSGSGSVVKTPDLVGYTAGSTVQLVATPSPGYTFSGWSGDASGTMNPLPVVMDRSRAITATFTVQTPQTYAVAVSVVGQGSVARTPDAAGYAAGTPVQLLATPSTGWRFAGWSGDVTGSTNPTTLTVSRGHSLVATFEPVTPSLTSSLRIVVVGEGTVTRSPDRDSFDPIETVELRAAPVTGWAFTEWKGDLTGTSVTARLPMTSSKTVIAVFEKLPGERKWTVVISGGANGKVTPSGTQTVNDGKTLRIEIQPDAGYQIDKLLVDGASAFLSSTAAQSYNLGPVTSNRQVQCSFVAIPVAPKVQQVRLTIGSKWLNVDGKQQALDAAPIIQNSRTLLPIRAIVEAFGGTITWHAELRVVDISLNGHQISLQIGSPQGWVDFARKPIDTSDPKVVPIIISGRTFLPLRFVAENLGLRVTWDAVTRTVTIAS